MADPKNYDESPKEDAKENSDEEILRIARERFDLSEEAESEIRIQAIDDLEFLSGNQWPEKIKNQRDQEDRPCLTINRMPQFVRQITNDQRQNRPSIKVNPVDDKADVETAKVYQGLIRHIENNSNADVAYDTAFAGAVSHGFGYFRVRTDYVSPTSFEQEILISQIKDSFRARLDPFHKSPDGSDSNWGFIDEDIAKDDFISQYPDSELAQSTEWESLGSQTEGWVSAHGVRVAEYFYKEFKKVTIVQLNTGESFQKDELPNPLPEGIEIVNERQSVIPVIKWCKLNGLEILEKTDWPGQWIPIIPVYGNELIVNGKRILEGVIRHAKDPQRMYNFWATSETETIALAPKAPFIIAEGQIPDEYKSHWETANTRTHAYLPYRQISLDGHPAPPPQRNAYEPPVQAITNARLQSSEDIKATTGMYDASLGNRSNESSGIAIQRRNLQAQTSNFHFVDNLTRSLRHAGRIIVDLIPKIYDTPRAQRIIGEEGEQEIIAINQIFEKKGEKVIYDLGAGKYDVTVETGPSFATKRQEALASMLDLTKAYPQVAQVAGDLMVKNMDWPGAQEIAERLKKTLAPGLADDDKEKKPIPPEAQAQMQQMNQMIEQLTGQLTAVSEEMKNKKLELESRERIETMKIERDYKLELLKLQGQAANEMMFQEFADIDRRQAMLHMNEPIDQEFNGQMPDQQMPDQQQQPTGGFPPGNFMEE